MQIFLSSCCQVSERDCPTSTYYCHNSLLLKTLHTVDRGLGGLELEVTSLIVIVLEGTSYEVRKAINNFSTSDLKLQTTIMTTLARYPLRSSSVSYILEISNTHPIELKAPQQGGTHTYYWKPSQPTVVGVVKDPSCSLF